jgi:hypothetical protein
VKAAHLPGVNYEDAQDICSELQKEPVRARQALSLNPSSSVDSGNPCPHACNFKCTTYTRSHIRTISFVGYDST